MRWHPDYDINGPGPLVRNPSNPSRRTRHRHQLLMDMLLDVGSFATMRQIMQAYPYLSEEYATKIAQGISNERREGELA